MQMAAQPIEHTCAEHRVYEALLSLDGKRILDLSRATVELTRTVAGTGRGRLVMALEPDVRRHASNLLIRDLPNVRFKWAGIEDIPAPDDSFDVVLMARSLHRIPRDRMARGLREVARVLRPGGYCYVSEPLGMGDYYELVRRIGDEQAQLSAAFTALRNAVEQGLFRVSRQVFFNLPVSFADFADFAGKVMGGRNGRGRMSATRYRHVERAFKRSLSQDGAHFTVPLRVDLLCKPLER